MKEQKNNQTNKTIRQSIKQTKTSKKKPTNRGTADPIFKKSFYVSFIFFT